MKSLFTFCNMTLFHQSLFYEADCEMSLMSICFAEIIELMLQWL